MKSILKRIWLLFSYGPELEDLVFKLRKEKEDRQKELERYNLKLCYKHKQEKNHSIYSEKNCDYCKLVKKVNNS